MARKSRCWFKCLAASAIAAFATSAAIAAPSTTIVISQVYGGGGNSDAPYTHDFVELHNISGGPINVTGWSVQYAGPTSAPAAWSTTSLSGVIPSGGYYLVQLDSTAAVGVALPAPDVTGTSALSATGGKIALSNTSAALAGGNPIGGATIVDFVGYGTSADAFEGTDSTAATSATKSAVRKDLGSQDTDDNFSDFSAGTVGSGDFIPRNSASPAYLPPTDTTPPAISSRIPGIAATGVSINTPVSITFDEPIAVGAGTVRLYKDALPFDQEISIGPVSISPASTASFTPTAPLEPGATYYLLIDATAFTDTVPALNPFPGISDESGWTFTTAVVPVLDLFSVGNNATTTATPNVTLDYNALSGGTPTEFIVSEQPDFSDTTWAALPASFVSLSAGNGTKTVYFKLRNGSGETGVLSDTIERVPYSNPGTLLITQYYEGSAGADKYIEITNTTAVTIDLSGWHLVRWGNDQAEAWKVTGSTIAASSGDLALSGIIAAGQAAVFANNAAVTPIPFASAFTADTKINHNGNDSYGLYQGAVSPENLRDAISFTNLGEEGVDKSFVRLSSGSGFDFAIGTSLLGFSSVWQEVSLATVNAAVSGQNSYLGTYPGTAGYGSWADLYADGDAADIDSDGDGIDNGTEYFMGTDPKTFNANSGLVGGTVTWPRVAGTTIGSFRVEVSSNLIDWADASSLSVGILSITTTEVSFTPPTDAGPFFVRLSVTP
jgi:hypothetical protein